MSRTVTVRIYVLVNSEGEWSSHGFKGCDDQDARDLTAECMVETEAERGYWVTAELPIPQRHEDEVAGTVEEDRTP